MLICASIKQRCTYTQGCCTGAGRDKVAVPTAPTRCCALHLLLEQHWYHTHALTPAKQCWHSINSAARASRLGVGKRMGKGHHQGTDLNWLNGYCILNDATHSMKSWERGMATTHTEALLSKVWPNTAYYWEKLWISHPWKCPRPGEMAPWASWFGGVWSSGWQPCWQQWSWNQMDFEVPSNPGHSMISKG